MVDGEIVNVVLNSEDVLTNEAVIAIAEFPSGTTVTTWTQFITPFIYKLSVDFEQLINYGYNLAIVFTSSAEGADFIGAIGSTLLIDEVQLVITDKLS